jgi:CheY-like chemotaxis protein
MKPNKPRVLVVDDEEGFRSFVRYVLEPLGYDVSGAASGQIAIGLMGAGNFDLILLDGYLNGMTGLETLRRLREVRPGISVAMLSIMSYTIEAQAFALGALACLPKPSDPETMVRLVGSLIGEDQ